MLKINDAAREIFPILSNSSHRYAKAHDCEPRRLLQILIEVQEIYRFIPPEAITSIARHLNLPRVSVEGAAGFYSFLSLEPAGEYRVLFSDNVTDQMLGNQELMRQFLQ